VLLIDENARVLDSTLTNTAGEFSFSVPVSGAYYQLRVIKQMFAEILTPAFEVLPRATVSLRIGLRPLLQGGRGVGTGLSFNSGRDSASTNLGTAFFTGQLGVVLRNASAAAARDSAAVSAGGRGRGSAVGATAARGSAVVAGGRSGPPAVSGSSVQSAGRGIAAIQGAGRGRAAGSGAGTSTGISTLLGGWPGLGTPRDAISGVLRFGTPPRTITTDSIVQLVSARFPQFFSDSAPADSVLIALVLDARGVATHTRMIPHRYAAMVEEGLMITEYSDSTSSMRAVRNGFLREIFPDLSDRAFVAGGSIKGRVSPRALQPRRITLIFGVLGG
jgi:hypothetical protein